MKKKYCFILIFFLLVIYLFGQNYSLDGFYAFQEDSLLSGIMIKGNQIIIRYDSSLENKKDEIHSFNIEHIDGLSFIILPQKMPSEIANWKVFEENKNIVTDNKILFLGYKQKYDTIFAYSKGYDMDKTPLTFTKFNERGSLYKDCTSYLVEKKKSYPVENLRKLAIDSPWVEGVPGDGIGEGFTIEGARYSKPLGPYLLIINGYISYEKPYLYKQNGRVKKIKVTGINSHKSKILEVLDTPHPQTVDISFITDPEDIRVEIADVYKGTKYDDTCIQYLITYDEPVIPYENSIE